MQDVQSSQCDQLMSSEPGAPRQVGYEAGTATAATTVPFVVTKEHRRFAEFADAVRRDIGNIGNQRYQNVLNVRRDTCAA